MKIQRQNLYYGENTIPCPEITFNDGMYDTVGRENYQVTRTKVAS